MFISMGPPPIAVRSSPCAPAARVALPLIPDPATTDSLQAQEPPTSRLRRLPAWQGLVFGAMAMVPAMASSMSSPSTVAPAASTISQAVSAPPPPKDGCSLPVLAPPVPTEGIILPPHAASGAESPPPCPWDATAAGDAAAGDATAAGDAAAAPDATAAGALIHPQQTSLQAPVNPLLPPVPTADPLADGLRHVRDTLIRLEKLAAQDHDMHARSGEIGGYEASFAIGRTKLEAKQGIDPQVDDDRPNLKSHVGLAFDTRLATAELKKSTTLDNGFTSTHGVSATVRAHVDFNVEHLLSTRGPSTLTQKRGFTLDTREEAYQSWSREISDSETVEIGIYGGYYNDLLHPAPQLYVESSQTLQHDVARTTPIFGGTTISATSREGVKSTVRIRDPFAYYELSGTVSKTWPVSLLGSQDLTVSTGIQLQRDQWTPLTVQPEVNATLKW